MECLSTGARQLLLKGNICAPCSRRYLSLNKPFPPSFAVPLRQYSSSSPNTRHKANPDNGSTAQKNTESCTKDSEPSQAYPLTGYYSLILSSPSPYHKQATTSRAVTEEPSEPAEQAASTPVEQSPQEKMSIVFGSRLASPGRSSRYNSSITTPESTWKTVNGVPVPPRPEEPDNCCMSGCAHCVWDDFRDEMEDWVGRVEKARARSASESPATEMRHAPRAEVASASTSMDDDGGGSEANWPAPDQNEDVFANIPVGIREFMKTEKRLKQRHQDAASP